MDTSPLVIRELNGSIAIITINRADKRNALSRALISALREAFDHVESDPRVRAVILTGSGVAFCAGMDLEELRATVEIPSESERIWGDAQRLSELYQKIYNLSKPTIAAVNGAAVAGGAGLTTVCDLAVAVPTSKFGYPEVRRGLVAAMVMPHLLRHVGERTARWLLLTGELLTAEQAMQVGLINAVVPAEQLMNTAKSWAKLILEGGPLALAKTKELLGRCSRQSVPVSELAHASAEPRLTDECQGGLKAFFEKRPVPWCQE